jgi:hypothetical protein
MLLPVLLLATLQAGPVEPLSAAGAASVAPGKGAVQEPKPAVQGAPERAAQETDEQRRRREWWEGLSEEKRREFEERRRRWEEMSPEAREELRRRMEVYRAEADAARAAMTPEESAAFEAMDGREKRHHLDNLVRARMAARAERLEQEIPSAREAMESTPDFDERRVRSAEMVEGYRRGRMARHIQRAVDEGWIGEHAAAWLREAPLHEAMVAIGEIEKWRYLQRAQAEGWWQAAAVGPEEQQRISGLPAHEFFRELRAVDMPRGGPPPDGRRGGGRGRRGGERDSERGDRGSDRGGR